MDVFTYHTLMMGHTKLGRFYKVLALYEEAIQSTAKVYACLVSRNDVLTLFPWYSWMVESSRSLCLPRLIQGCLNWYLV